MNPSPIKDIEYSTGIFNISVNNRDEGNLTLSILIPDQRWAIAEWVVSRERFRPTPLPGEVTR